MDSLSSDGVGVPALGAYLQMLRLKALYRQGWLKAGVPRLQCESVAEHTVGVAWLALLIAPSLPGVDVWRTARLALIHDLGESHAGDVTPSDGVSSAEKFARECAGVERVVAGLADAAEWLALWEEYEGGVSVEARLVRELDRLEMGIQAAVYSARGLIDPTGFLASARAALATPALRAILAAAASGAEPATATE